VARIITETLKGVHSFRGCGMIQINELGTMICGSKQFNFGNRGKVRYLEHQIKRVPEETPVKGLLVGLYTQGVGIRHPYNQTVLLDEGTSEELSNGLMNTGWSYIVPFPPLKIRIAANVHELNNPEILPDALAADGFLCAVYEE